MPQDVDLQFVLIAMHSENLKISYVAYTLRPANEYTDCGRVLGERQNSGASICYS